MQKELTTNAPVPDKNGRPIAGFSRRSILRYTRDNIKAPPYRIKEWDFYQITNSSLCLQFTVGHASYAGQISIMLFDFEKKQQLLNKSKLLLLPFGSLHLVSDAEQTGSYVYNKNGIYICIETTQDKRTIICKWEYIESVITLRRKSKDSIVLTVPFDESPHDFYYNQKINCMTAEGFIKSGTQIWEFEEQNSFGLLDWGRGVWPFHNEWYWSNGTGYVDDKIFGFNLGCGFGNTDTATENMLFYGEKSYKLGKVSFSCDHSNYMTPWHITDDQGLLDLILTPTYDRTATTKMLWIDNCTHQMFGTFKGAAMLEDGTNLKIDNIISFAEYAINNW